MGKISDSLYDEIHNNAEHGVHQYGLGLHKLQSLIDGVRKENIVTIGGTSGSGKSSFVLYAYVYRPIMECMAKGKRDLTVIIFCMEMTPQKTLSKLLSLYLWDKYGLECGTRDMLSFSSKVSKDLMEKLDEAKAVVDRMEEYIRFVEGAVNTESLREYMDKYFATKGSYVDGKYVPNDPWHITVGILDHIGEVTIPPGRTKKQEIDSVADLCKVYRNSHGMSWCILQQINRGASNVQRRDKFPGLEMDDLKESGNVSEKSDSVIGLYYPFRMKDFNYGGYKVRELRQILKIAQVLKSRWGVADMSIGLSFYGKSGKFAELPKSNEIADYSRYLKPDWTREQQEIENTLDEI